MLQQGGRSLFAGSGGATGVVPAALSRAGAAAVADLPCGALCPASALTRGGADFGAVPEIADAGAACGWGWATGAELPALTGGGDTAWGAPGPAVAGGIALAVLSDDARAALCDAGGDDPALFEGSGDDGKSWHAMP